MDVKEGDVLAGKYRVEKVLGQGGMGVVVAATHLQLDQRVALKFLLPEALQRPETLGRFAREARAAAKIRSEHIARVIDVGSLESGLPYIVMEYLEGSDLAGVLAKRGPLPVAQAAELTLEACDALAEAHSLGIVHRDLKPANLFLARAPDQTECVKILDFGISKMASPEAAEFNMTQTGAIVGSPYYMSPEQMRSSRSVDARTDIWSLGVILYELVSGRVPFDAPTLPQLCGMILTEAPPALGQWRGDVPIRFQGLVARCLEKDVGMRFQTVAELAVALAEFAPARAGRSVERILRLSGTPSVPSPAGSEGAHPNERPARTDWGRTSTRTARSRGLWGAAAGFALMVGGASWVFLRGPARASHGAELGGAPDMPRPIGAGAPAMSARSPVPAPPDAAVEPTASAPAAALREIVAVPPGSALAGASPAAPPRHAPVPRRASPAPTSAPTAPPAGASNPLDGRM